MHTQHQNTQLLTVRQLSDDQPALTEGGIRWDLFHRQTNGLAASGAVIQHGRKILIDPELYIAWIASGKGGGK